MPRPWIALALYALYFGLAFGWRSLRQRRATGSTGFRGISGPPGSLPWLGGVLFAIALLLAVLAPVVELARWVGPLAEPSPLVVGLGAATTIAGILGTLWSQGAMGESWRVGVSEAERTSLVTRGPFAVVRNPIFSFMMLAALGLALVLPNAAALASFLALVVAIELQVRFVEEPYLLRTHGNAYAEYCARAGRFIPGFGLGVPSKRTVDGASVPGKASSRDE
ncbi:isoprenylcysteine carboxylmethyltransferase family protein [Sorangium sp. So ce295]|uniref:methyltransferase family protein n=1 Tax=Sorangium sp. So ce295 TaxID=3133295 RepID=UPI003F63AC90